MRKCLSLVPQTRGFKIASLNIASLPAHIDELRLFMADKNLDVLAINETRLSDSIDNSCIHMQGYDIVRRDRNRNVEEYVYIFALRSISKHDQAS